MGLLDQFVRHIAYPLNEVRQGTRVLPDLSALLKSQYIDPEQLNQLRLRKLRALLDHAYRNTRFYRRRFSEGDITPESIRDFNDLRRLPPLTKVDIVGFLDELRAESLAAADIHRTATGGSTGTHTPFYRDNKCLEMKLAAQFRFCIWSGWRVGQKTLMFWPSLLDFAAHKSLKARLRTGLIDRNRLWYSGSLNEQLMDCYARQFNRYRPRLVRAFPNPLAVFASFLQQSGYSVAPPVGVITTGEPLLSSQRKLFETVFGCPVYDCYGSRECGHTAAECERHEGLHINAECLHLEFETNNAPARPGQPGRILITDFENYGMPFIRYDIGDIGIPLDRYCSCGRSLPLMAMEAGRISDFVVSPYDGSFISGSSLCHYFIAEGPDVGQLQLIQDARDHLTIRMKRSCRETRQPLAAAHLEAVVKRIFHGAMQLTVQEVETIPNEKSGKYRFCINRYLEEAAQAPPE